MGRRAPCCRCLVPTLDRRLTSRRLKHRRGAANLGERHPGDSSKSASIAARLRGPLRTTATQGPARALPHAQRARSKMTAETRMAVCFDSSHCCVLDFAVCSADCAGASEADAGTEEGPGLVGSVPSPPQATSPAVSAAPSHATSRVTSHAAQRVADTATSERENLFIVVLLKYPCTDATAARNRRTMRPCSAVQQPMCSPVSATRAYRLRGLHGWESRY
jgi:hypothetical protein